MKQIERDVLRLWKQGKVSREIAQELRLPFRLVLSIVDDICPHGTWTR